MPAVSTPLSIVDRPRLVAGLEAMLEESREHAEHAALLLVDLSNLLALNHQHGYLIGDQLLQEAGAQLCALSKRPDSVYRVSSKTFALLLPRIANAAFIALAVSRVQHTLDEALFIDEDMLPVDLRFGLSLNHNAREPALSTLARAEACLEQSRQGVPLDLEGAIREEVPPQIDRFMGQRFADALHNNDFELYFQPKMDLHSGELCGAEALIRWQLAGHGFVPPEEVVALAYASGQEFELTRWVVNRALRYQREWRESFLLPLAVNLPADLVSSPDLPGMLQASLAIWGAEPAGLTVEITESAVIKDKEAGSRNLDRLRALGVGISIDDFGTGFSSLSYFREIPATELKIDRSFVKDLLQDHISRDLVRHRRDRPSVWSQGGRRGRGGSGNS